jgi:DNA helicase-2/ATP-dependent DNA helicase PcrA
MLEWLRLKIATDTSEDEPVDPELVQGDRVCVALTVHKAKGLQYARVLIPFTQGRFLRDVSAGHTKAAVVDQGSEVRLLWQWLPTASGSSLLRNTRGDDPALAVDQAETLAEEARLLYVAMTRARDELIVMRGAPARAGEPPNRWTDLIRMWRP